MKQFAVYTIDEQFIDVINYLKANNISYEAHLAKSYAYWLKCAGSREQQRSIKRKTKGDWRNAYLPLNIALMHKRAAGQSTEPHARVYLADAPSAVVDITWADWEKLEKSSPKQI